ncbi:MAG: hypothetical protein HY901_04295 [Deltaproteobacteria bacterium]|nr:hypothetical protein [Deltaproteobacteria bacterium]
MKRAALWILATNLLGACGASSEGGSPLATREALFDAFVAAICEREAACCPKNETATECSSHFAKLIAPLVSNQAFKIDAEKAAACRATIASTTCDVVGAHGGILPLAFCGQFWSGTTPNGAACGIGDLYNAVWSDEECASGFCVEHVCTVPGGVDAKCSDTGGCLPGQWCNAERCRPRVANGGDCTDELCLEGFACNRTSFDTPTCQPLVVIEPGAECVPGTTCRLGDETCRCSVEGCPYGTCGDTSHCKQ